MSTANIPMNNKFLLSLTHACWLFIGLAPFFWGILMFPPENDYLALIEFGRRSIMFTALACAWVSFITLFRKLVLRKNYQHQFISICLTIISAIIAVIFLQLLSATVIKLNFVIILATLGFHAFSVAWQEQKRYLPQILAVTIRNILIAYCSLLISQAEVRNSQVSLVLAFGVLASFPEIIILLQLLSRKNAALKSTSDACVISYEKKDTPEMKELLCVTPLKTMSVIASSVFLVAPLAIGFATYMHTLPQIFLITLLVIPIAQRVLVHLQIARYSNKIPDECITLAIASCFAGNLLLFTSRFVSALL